jgi:hypothetical protein
MVEYLPDRGCWSGANGSVRLGRPLEADPPLGWSTPPERASQSSSAWRPDDDWFGFGMMCARLLLDSERYAKNAPDERYVRVLRAVDAATRQLTEGSRISFSASLPPIRSSASFEPTISWPAFATSSGACPPLQ